MTSGDVAPVILSFCGEALCACRLQVALSRHGEALRRILLSGVMNELLARESLSGCSRRGLAYVERWLARLEPSCRVRGILGWLRSGVRGHGTARVRPAWIEADESLVLVSLPVYAHSGMAVSRRPQDEEVARDSDRRVLFAVCGSDRNLCDSGCWCTGKVTQTVCCFLPMARRRRRAKRATLTPLVAFGSRYGRGTDGTPPALWAAKAHTCALVADALNLPVADLGIVVKFLFVAATDSGKRRWNSLEKAHAQALRREKLVLHLERHHIILQDDDLLSDDSSHPDGRLSIGFSDLFSDDDLFDSSEEEHYDTDYDDDDEYTSDSSRSISMEEDATDVFRSSSYAVRDFPRLSGSQNSSIADLLHSWDEGGITPRRLLQRAADRLEYQLPDRKSSDLTRLAAALSNWADITEQVLQQDDEVAAFCFSPLLSRRPGVARLA